MKSQSRASWFIQLPQRRRLGLLPLVGFAVVIGLIWMASASDSLSKITWLGTTFSLTTVLWLLVFLAGIGTLLALIKFFREVLEQLIEVLIWPLYRVTVYGPGVKQIPRRGPLLVIANHTAWFDPIWLGKVIPRRLTPLMTSRFFDLPVLHWLMTKVVGAIRVQAAQFRRHAPELDEAIAALDGGAAVVLFPEGYMKRRPEQTLRQFGQGIWRILSQRPGIPVLVCWIEGGWGSYASYCGGPPTVNKHLDWWRPIGIGLTAPQVIDRALLADHRATRVYLMQACLQARQYLGLEPLSLSEEPDEQPSSDLISERPV